MSKIARRIRGIIIILFFLAIAFYTCILLIVNLWGKDIFATQIAKTLSRDVQIEKVTLTYTLKLKIEKLIIDRLLTADEVYITKLPTNFLADRLDFGKIIVTNAAVLIDREEWEPLLLKTNPDMPVQAGDSFSWAVVPSQSGNETISQPDKAVIEKFKVNKDKKDSDGKTVLIKSLVIKDSKVLLTDGQKKGDPFKLDIEGLNLTVKNLNLSERGSTKIQFDMSSKVLWSDEKQCDITVAGWVDYPNRAMDAKVTLKNVDYAYFGDYYPWKFRPETLGLETLYLTSVADLKAEDNKLNVSTIVEVDSVEYTPIAEGEEEQPRTKLFKTILQLFQGTNEKPTVKFKFETQMDSPTLNMAALKKEMMKQSGLDIGQMFNIAVSKVIEDSGGNIKNAPSAAVDVTRTVVEGVLDGADSTTSQIVGGVFDILSGVLGSKTKSNTSEQTAE
ncbi:MAG: DUF748 domain-containing protein [Candidatus Omnitrophica bacterium]|nr:DUF748 domain-containing protein [Candidatus Omnitrophota bacterium]